MLTERQRVIVRAVLAPYSADIDRVALFGSRALGTAHPASDIDLVLYGRLSEAQLARLWTRFDESGLAVTVDLIDYAQTHHAPLKRHIDAVAIPLFTNDDLRVPALSQGSRP